MNDCMTQEDAMNMDNEQAVNILKPLQKMMLDQYGCPISSAYFALGKAIESLTADVRANVHGEWVYDSDYVEWSCSKCGIVVEDELEKPSYRFCPWCGADMRGEQDE